jgi:hypothetical protein
VVAHILDIWVNFYVIALLFGYDKSSVFGSECNFTQMVDGTPVESSIPKDIIVEIYKVVGNYRRQ